MDKFAESVDPAEIDSSFDSYSCSWPGESTRLEESIARVGLINPPLLKRSGGNLVTVCGIRRVRAALKLSMPRIPCRIVESAGRSDADLLALNLEDNLSVRALGLFESARLVSLLEAFDGDSRSSIVERYGPAIGLRGDEYEVSRFLSLHVLSDAVKVFVASKKMAPRQAFRLALLGSDDAGRLVELAGTFALTASQTGEFAELAREILLRDGLTFEELAPDLADGLESTADARHKQRDAIMDRLRMVRFPRWQEKERAMKSCLDRINGTAGITVHAPPYLENDIFNVRLVYRSCEELAERARALETFAGTEDARKAFGLL